MLRVHDQAEFVRAVREFSEKLRLLVEQEFGLSETLFPQHRRLKKEFRDLLERRPSMARPGRARAPPPLHGSGLGAGHDPQPELLGPDQYG